VCVALSTAAVLTCPRSSYSHGARGARPFTRKTSHFLVGMAVSWTQGSDNVTPLSTECYRRNAIDGTGRPRVGVDAGVNAGVDADVGRVGSRVNASWRKSLDQSYLLVTLL
jgi:hypothetical protein